MTAEVNEMGDCEASLDIAKAEVDRVLADTRFRATERQRNILRYLAGCRFAGCNKGVKAYSIALDVLGRTSAFDAGTDPIVRIEISRLRSALDAYYEAFGDSWGVSIHIPKGSYVALFPKTVIRHGPEEDQEDVERRDTPVDPEEPSAAISSPRSGIRTRTITVAAAAILFVGLAAAGTYALVLDGAAPVSQPTVYLSMEAAQDTLQDEATQTRELVLAAMTQFQTFSVGKAGPAGGRSLPRGRTYEIDMKYYGDGDDRSVWWQIVDVASGNLLRSGLEKVDTSGRSDTAVRQDMAGSLARTFASARGVINGIEMLSAPPGALGNPCVLRAEFALDQGGPTAAAATTHCLERTLALQPDDPNAAALLSRVLLVGDDGDASGTQARAMELAKHAVSIAPLSDRAQTALMTAQFATGRTEAAIDAGNRAIAANPNNADSAGELAMVLYASGYADAGVSMARDAARGADAIPRAAALVLAFDAYGRGQYSEASLAAEQIACADFLVKTLRTAALGELGATEARERLLDLRGGIADFDQVSRRKLMASRLPPALVAQLQSGLAKAGSVALASAAGP
jgi:hypothetical protein